MARHLRVPDRLRCTVLSSVMRRPVSLRGFGPIVSFTFDDFPRTALTQGGAILREYGAQGTYYTAFGLMNRRNELGEHFTEDDLHLLLHDGHEIGSHTLNHVSAAVTSPHEFADEVRRGCETLETVAGLGMCRNFAFPFGAVTIRTKRLIANDIASARSIWGGVNGPSVDLNLLRANRLYGDGQESFSIKQLIAQNVRQQGWLIFYTHDVRASPSPYGCTPNLLRLAVSHAAKSGARLLPIGRVMHLLRARY